MCLRVRVRLRQTSARDAPPLPPSLAHTAPLPTPSTNTHAFDTHTHTRGRSQLLDEVKAIAARNPSTMRYEVRSAADGGYSVEMPVLTVAPGGLPGAGREGGGAEGKVRLLLDFGQHARELVSGEVGLRLIRALGDVAEMERAAGSAERAARVRRLLEACVFVVSGAPRWGVCLWGRGWRERGVGRDKQDACLCVCVCVCV